MPQKVELDLTTFDWKKILSILQVILQSLQAEKQKVSAKPSAPGCSDPNVDVMLHEATLRMTEALYSQMSAHEAYCLCQNQDQAVEKH